MDLKPETPIWDWSQIRRQQKLEYNWFPESGNDDGAMLFNNRKDLVKGTKLIMDHFARFSLEMHVGRGDKASKTECVYFLAFENEYETADTRNFEVNDGFVQFTKQFKYLGSTISYNLNDSVKIDARISQASKQSHGSSAKILLM
eukprot:scaffold129607_cov53-Attheya_sp.AAC.7